MTTTLVSNLITDIRYDLQDLGKNKFDDSFLIKMIGRGVRVLEQELSAIGSDLGVLSTTSTLSSGNNYINLDKTVDHIIHVYIDQDEIYKRPLRWLYRYRADVIGTGTGQPYFFSIWGKPAGSNGRRIEFDYTANTNYTITYIYQYKTGELAASDYIPYDEMFNDYIREGTVMICRKVEDDEILQTDQVFRQVFREYVFQFDRAVSYVPKYYKRDF